MTTRLCGIRILLAEDNGGLAKRVGALLVEEGADVEVVRHLAGAKETLDSSDRRFHVAVLDVMLPKNANDLESVETFELELNKLRNQLMDPSTPPELQKDLREKRHKLLQRIDELIVLDAGLQAAEVASSNQIPVVFLTAIGNHTTRQEATRSYPGSVWLVKPVSGEALIGAVVRVGVPKDDAE